MGNDGSAFKNDAKMHVQDTECVSVHLLLNISIIRKIGLL